MKERIEKRITELEKARDNFIKQANQADQCLHSTTTPWRRKLCPCCSAHTQLEFKKNLVRTCLTSVLVT